jgi:hypothetical protein
MFVSWYRIIPIIVLVVLLGCSGAESFVVTLTPEGTKGTIPTMTSMPSIIYPTLVPTRELTITPTLEAMLCDETPVTIECKATVCIVRDSPSSGTGAIAYTVPNSTLLDGALSCRCETCASIEQNWFYLGETNEDQFWAISMYKVWELKD